MEELGQYLGPHAANAAYHPDIWAAGSPAPYRAALLPCLQELCGGGEA